MRTRTTAIAATALGATLLLAVVTACTQSEAEVRATCERALDNHSTLDNRPEACQEVPDESYRTLLLVYDLKAEGLD
ncbi:hypothetical protein [Streptomyces fulvorobeus]|uniref:Lipoprotein n=1 Tax=Streptomyces fulvorobeus TaxID=284028 RepID=A0A7J0C8A8_9ACTN|nr:hypothetical protein [Streptomyces fulvorobeus]NYE42063.1 hypothetical protein [Streptomyces fulvorobeus]GFM98437.1 hypothetical protein Sfulv_32480 [Streptomyces fulvorobeus]